MLELEMCSVTSVLKENTKPSSPVWCVWSLTVKLILSGMRSFAQENDTKWLMPRDDCRRWSARNTRSSLRFSVALIRHVYVCCVRWMNIKTMKLYRLQHRGQRNRYLKLDTDEILLTLVSYVFISTPVLTAYSIHTAHNSRNEQQLQEEFHYSMNYTVNLNQHKFSWNSIWLSNIK